VISLIFKLGIVMPFASNPNKVVLYYEACISVILVHP